jgi:4-hydroxy-3-polyprenylbenzoate decarboxylase
LAYKDLRDFISFLEKKGELVRVREKVSYNLEIAEITDRVSKSNGPALFFENVENSDFPVVTNLFGSYKRMAWALGVEEIEDVPKRIEKLLSQKPPETLLDKIKMLPQLFEFAKYFPKVVKSAPCQEVVEENPDVTKLPALFCWPKDGGRFITLPLVFTKDPETGVRNCGMYRMHIYDAKTTGMHWHLHKDGSHHYIKAEKLGKRLEVAVAIGSDPAVIYSATAPLPAGIDEMLFAGFLRKEPVELVKCKTVDLEVPANAEFVLEGYVDPYERRVEGPFGDHTGFYSPAEEYPVFHITCITRRKSPIYPATLVGKPPMEDCYMAKATERIFLPLLRLDFPEIVDMNLPMEGVFHNCAIISIKKTYPGQAKKVINGLWGKGQMMFAKLIIVVDEDVNVQDLQYTAWRVLNNVDWKRDVLITEGPVDALDHSASFPRYGSKMGIDATRKSREEGMMRDWPEEIEMSEEIKRLVSDKWERYGIKL